MGENSKVANFRAGSAASVTLSKDEALCLLKIKEQLDYIGELFDSLTPEAKDQFRRFHIEFYSLNHCLRWGREAVQELSESASIRD